MTNSNQRLELPGIWRLFYWITTLGSAGFAAYAIAWQPEDWIIATVLGTMFAVYGFRLATVRAEVRSEGVLIRNIFGTLLVSAPTWFTIESGLVFDELRIGNDEVEKVVVAGRRFRLPHIRPSRVVEDFAAEVARSNLPN